MHGPHCHTNGNVLVTVHGGGQAERGKQQCAVSVPSMDVSLFTHTVDCITMSLPGSRPPLSAPGAM